MAARGEETSPGENQSSSAAHPFLACDRRESNDGDSDGLINFDAYQTDCHFLRVSWVSKKVSRV
jgi:hypothetical protein